MDRARSTSDQVSDPRPGAVSARRPPGPPGRFVVGQTLEYARDPLGFFTRCAREYGDVVRLRLGGTRVYLVSHPALVEEVLRTRAGDVIKDRFTQSIVPIVGRGLVTSEGDLWRRQRRLTQPAFQHQRTERYGTAMVEFARGLAATWAEAARDPVDPSRDVHEDLSALTLAIVGKTLFGSDVGGAAQRLGPALADIMRHYLSPVTFLPFHHLLPIRSARAFRAGMRVVDRVVYGLVRQRRQSAAGAGAEGTDDLLGRFLAAHDEDGSKMTDRQLRDECVTLFLAGHETTALALTYAFHLLAHHPAADARLHAELAAVLGDRPPTPADVPRLEYTSAVISEAMRLYPPVWAIGREAVRPFTLGGFQVTRGTQLVVSQWVLHRDPRWWNDPDAFRPERWEGDLAHRLPRGAYIPFGAGPRVCIGNHFAMMEAVLVLATLARAVRLEPAPGRALGLVPSITLRPEGATRMLLRPREHPAN